MSREKRKNLTHELFAQLQEMSTGAVLISHVIASRVGLVPTDLEAVEAISRTGSMTAGEISKVTGLTTGAVTGVIDRLEKANYVSRKNDPKDRRKVIVVVNQEKVQKELVPLYKGIINTTNKILENYSNSDIEVFIDFLRKSNTKSRTEIEKLQQDI